MKNFRSFFYLIFFLILISQTTCGAGGDAVTIEPGVYVGTCFGRIIDRSTREGISGAIVELFAGNINTDDNNVSGDEASESNFVATTTAASDDSDTSLWDEAGMFSIENVPTGDAYRLRISASGYATLEATCNIAQSLDQSAITEDIGDINMTLGADVTVILTDNETGQNISGCPVFATPGTNGELANSFDANDLIRGVEVSSSTTDTDGDGVASATLSGLNPLMEYTIVAPACDQDGDGGYDYQSAVATFDEGIDTDSTFNVGVTPAGNNDTPQLIATSCGQFSPTEDAAMAGCAMTTSGTLIYVFNYPVTDVDLQLVQNAESTFTDGSLGNIWSGGTNTLDFDGDDTVETTTTDIAMTASLSGGNTILTITPTAATTVDALLTLEGTVTASDPGASDDGDIESMDFIALINAFGLNNDLIYVLTAGDVAITNPTADNYNSDDDSAVAATVCLEFQEAVIGTVQILATTSAGVTTTNQNPGQINLNTGALVNESDDAINTICGGLDGCASSTDATCSATSDSEDIIYAVSLTGTTLADHTAATSQTVTVYVDAMDYEGNQLQGEVTLEVQ